MAERVSRAGVDVRVLTAVRAVSPGPGGTVRVETEGPDGPGTVEAEHVFCCGYSQ